MKSITEASDQRHKSWCIHCGVDINQTKTNRDHVPSKSLLEKPYPAELPTVEICTECNTSFSQDEEYFAAFMGAILSGTTQPERQKVRTARRVFTENTSLRKRIEAQRKSFETIGGERKTTWEPEINRLHNVIVKNARGHVYYELGQPALGDPVRITVRPLEGLTEEELNNFLAVDYGSIWPEVGSRMMQRLCSGYDMEDGWIVVQNGNYRFAAMENDGFQVRMIIREYLAAEVIWET